MKTKYLTLAILIALLIGACVPTETPAPPEPTPDVSAARTSAVKTVLAEITSAAAAVTATSTSTQAPTITPTSTATLDIAALLSPGPGTQALLSDNTNIAVDVNYPDGSEVTAGQEFIKTWRIRNTGLVAWGAGYQIIYAFGEKMNGKPQPLTATVVPGQEVEISVQFTAPTKAGQYNSTWRMANALGSPFGEEFYVLIVVR